MSHKSSRSGNKPSLQYFRLGSGMSRNAHLAMSKGKVTQGSITQKMLSGAGVTDSLDFILWLIDSRYLISHEAHHVGSEAQLERFYDLHTLHNDLEYLKQSVDWKAITKKYTKYCHAYTSLSQEV